MLRQGRCSQLETQVSCHRLVIMEAAAFCTNLVTTLTKDLLAFCEMMTKWFVVGWCFFFTSVLTWNFPFLAKGIRPWKRFFEKQFDFVFTLLFLLVFILIWYWERSTLESSVLPNCFENLMAKKSLAFCNKMFLGFWYLNSFLPT